MTKKDDKTAFNDLFSIARLYNSAYSYETNHPIRIYPIMMSIIFHHYKILKEKYFGKYHFYNFDYIYNDYNTSSNNNILNQMLQSSYKYSNAKIAKGKQFSKLLIMFLLFKHYKI